ncbi:MAG: hypothetical protein ACYDCD_01985 [Candidatus Acidiferrales bacterium]
MRSVLPILLLVLVGPAFGQTSWFRVSTVHYEWNHDGRPFTFILDKPTKWKGPGFTRLRILTPSHGQLTVEDADGLVKYADELGPTWVEPHFTALMKENPVKSPFLLLLPADAKSRTPSLVFVVGWDYGSSPGSLHVIALGKGGARQILYRKEFQLTDYLDLNGDGHREIIGKECLSQTWGADFLTYDPYSVYSISRGRTLRAHLSISLSKKYNIEHYYGWAGPDCSEKLAVVLHPPGGGKPIIMNAKKAEELTAKTSKPEK